MTGMGGDSGKTVSFSFLWRSGALVMWTMHLQIKFSVILTFFFNVND